MREKLYLNKNVALDEQKQSFYSYRLLCLHQWTLLNHNPKLIIKREITLLFVKTVEEHHSLKVRSHGAAAAAAKTLAALLPHRVNKPLIRLGTGADGGFFSQFTKG